MPEAGIKRLPSDCKTENPDPKIKIEPDVKRPKLDDEITAPVKQPLNIVDVDPTGDLLFVFESRSTAYRIDSNTLKRTSKLLYQECLAVRRTDDSAWTFKGVDNGLEEATEVVLNVIHANFDQVPDTVPASMLHNILTFTKRYEMMDRFLRTIKQWFHMMSSEGSESNTSSWKCSKLWVANDLGFDEQLKNLQIWAVFSLSPDGDGGIGDPLEIQAGKRLELSNFALANNVVTGKILYFLPPKSFMCDGVLIIEFAQTGSFDCVLKQSTI